MAEADIQIMPWFRDWFRDTNPVAFGKNPVNWGEFYTGLTNVQTFGKARELPTGEFVQEDKAHPFDFLLGRSPLAKPLEEVDAVTGAPTGETTDPTAAFFGGFDFGSALARVSIVVLGFIFVAVGLSMFSNK